jgi:hypothetical protein
MLKPDFSDIQKNGFRIQQFRLTWSQDMRSDRFKKLLADYDTSGNLLKQRNLTLQRMTEQNEIDFTIYYFSLRLMILSIIVALLSLVFLHTGLGVTIISGFTSLIFYLVARKFKEGFILGNFGIQISEDFFNSKIKEKYNF